MRKKPLLDRLIPGALLLWLVLGPAIWWLQRDSEPEEGVEEPVTLEEAEEARGSLAAPSDVSAPVASAPELKPPAAAGSAAALMNRLGRAMSAEQRADITAWLRAHPDQVCELIAAFNGSAIGYVAGGYLAFMHAVLDPLADLKPTLTAGLMECLTERPTARHGWPPALIALAALAPLSRETRGSLEAWAREHPASPWLQTAVGLILADAASGEEILSLVHWLVTPPEIGRLTVHVPHLMHAVAKLGERGKVLVPELVAYLLTVEANSTVARTLIAIGADDPVAQRALVALTWTHDGAQEPAWKYLSERADGKGIVLGALRDDSPRVRLSAVSFLLQKRWVPQATLLPAVLATLTAPDVLWRDRAMRMVPSFAERAEDVVPTLEAMFRSHDEQQWLTAAKTLHLLASASGDRFAVTGTLRDALQHDNVGVRRVVVQSLMSYTPAAAVPMLRGALRDDDAIVRERASDALGELAQRDAGALAALREALGHTDPDVVAMAEAWIEEIESAAAAEGGK